LEGPGVKTAYIPIGVVMALTIAFFAVRREDSWPSRFEDYGVVTYKRTKKTGDSLLGASLLLSTELIMRYDPDSTVLHLAISHFDEPRREEMRQAFWDGLKAGKTGDEPARPVDYPPPSPEFKRQYEAILFAHPFDKHWSKSALAFCKKELLEHKATFVERAALAKLLIGVYRLNFAESHEAKSIIMSLKDESNGDEARFWSLIVSVMAPAKQP
jgi:hypothetical protein